MLFCHNWQLDFYHHPPPPFRGCPISVTHPLSYIQISPANKSNISLNITKPTQIKACAEICPQWCCNKTNYLRISQKLPFVHLFIFLPLRIFFFHDMEWKSILLCIGIWKAIKFQCTTVCHSSVPVCVLNSLV